MPLMVRAASLTGYAELARSIGLDAGKMLREAGLDRSCLSNPDQKIPCDALTALLENSAAAAYVFDFGLRLSEGRRLSNLGPIALAIRDAPTIREAVKIATRYLPLQSEALMLSFEVSGDVTFLKYDVLADARLPGRQRTEMGFTALYGMISQIAGAHWRRPRVWFSHSAPANLASHLRIFGPWVEFGRDCNALVFDTTDLDRPLDSSDPAMTSHVQQYLDPLLAQVNLSLAEKTKRLVHDLLISGRASADLVASGLGLSRRTLHRQLTEDGETFSSIVDAVRKDLVARRLSDEGVSLTDLAYQLGFSAPSGFSRWFRTEFGCSPTSWRHQSQAGVNF